MRDVDALAELRARMNAAENAGDPSVFEEVLAEDAVILLPNMPPIEGKAACLDFIRAVLDDVKAEFDRQMTVVSAEMQINGDWAFDRGTFSQTLESRAGGATIRESGKYFWLHTRVQDGSWKVARIIGSMDESEC